MGLRYLRDGMVHVSAGASAHPRQLDRGEARARPLGARPRRQDSRHLQPAGRRILSPAYRRRARRGAGALAAGARPAGAACCLAASASRSTRSGCCGRCAPWPGAAHWPQRRGGAVRGPRARRADQRARASLRRAARAGVRGAFPRRGEGHPLALLGVGPAGDAVAVRGAGQRRAGRLRRRPARDPLSRRQRRRHRASPGETGWEVPPVRHAPLVRALGEALSRAGRSAGRDGPRPAAPTWPPGSPRARTTCWIRWWRSTTSCWPGPAPARATPRPDDGDRAATICNRADRARGRGVCGAAAQPVGAAPATAQRRGQLSRGCARLSTGRGRGRRDPLPHRRPVPRGQPLSGLHAGAAGVRVRRAGVLCGREAALARNRAFPDGPRRPAGVARVLARGGRRHRRAAGLAADPRRDRERRARGRHVRGGAPRLRDRHRRDARTRSARLAGRGRDDRPRLPDQGERPPRVPRPRDGRRGGAGPPAAHRAAHLRRGGGLRRGDGVPALAERRRVQEPVPQLQRPHAVARRLERRVAPAPRPGVGSRRPALVPAAPFGVGAALAGDQGRRPVDRCPHLHGRSWRHGGHAGASQADHPGGDPARCGRRGGRGARGARARQSLPDRTPHRGAGRDARRWLDAAGVRGRRAGRGRRRDALHVAVRRAVHPLRGVCTGSTRRPRPRGGVARTPVGAPRVARSLRDQAGLVRARVRREPAARVRGAPAVDRDVGVAPRAPSAR